MSMKISTKSGLLVITAALLVAAGAVSAAPPIVAVCKACHDVDGSGVGRPYVPIIAGIPPVHIVEALYAYKDGARQCKVEPAMCSTVALLSDQDIEELADYYGKLPRFSHASTFNEELAAVVTLQDGEVFENDNRVAAALEGKICHRGLQASPIHMTSHGRLLLLRSSDHSSGAG